MTAPVGTLSDLEEAITEGLCPAIRNNPAIGLFLQNRATFEGWLKVEFSRALIDRGWQVSPEETIPESSMRVDLRAGRWWIELKTVSTNYSAVGAYRGISRPITRNIQSVVNDIRKLRTHALTPSAILFVASPLPNPPDAAWSFWETQLNRVRAELGSQVSVKEFGLDFPGIPGRLYLAPI